MATGMRDLRDQIQTVDGVEADREARSDPSTFMLSCEIPVSNDAWLDLVGAQID